jgi:YD repeat-containing protein
LGSGSRTQYRDASGRLTGTESTQRTSTMTTTRRDASGRLVSSSSGSGKCQSPVRVPTPPNGTPR